MGKVAFVFPGQGSQHVGMGKELAQKDPLARELFDTASKILGYDLGKLCWEGPEEKLRQTVYTQPALLTVSVALYQVLYRQGVRPDVVAGHSLGEYSALVAAQALPFATAVRVVARRGQLMEEAVPAGRGTMAVILGLEAAVVREICQAASQEGRVEPANYNGAGQIVIAGERPAVTRAMDLARERGARRVLELPVSGPFHSSLMQPAGRKLAEELQSVDIDTPKIPLVSNVTADYVRERDSLRELLAAQVHSPVRWEETVLRFLADGVDTFVEVGPGRVLSGLVKRIARDARVVGFQGPADLEKVLDLMKGDIVR